ncbi:MAG: hypothetical protein IJ146_14325 [Kiritimatiellae bacterium]|nr:hypothetical protein [Kiritimatiellia bacterium]
MMKNIRVTRLTRCVSSASAFAAFVVAVMLQASAGLMYEPSNYVAQENLVLNFDGIRNAGLLKAHDGEASVWKNIGRVANDATLVGNDGPANAWTADGYRFNGGTYGVLKYAQDLGGQLTIQIVCDVKSSENYTSWPTMFGNWNDRANIYYSDTLSKVHFKADYTTGLSPGSRSKIGGWHGRYINAGLDSAAHRQTLTEDVSFSSWVGGSSSNTSPGVQTWTLGSAGANGGLSQEELNARYLVGTIKAVRVYNKVLSDAELAANRAIDEARFFVGIPVTNVVVATSVAGLEGNEGSGAYAYDAGGYTFTAPQKAVKDGTVYSCAGYTLETWNEFAGIWGEPVTYASCSYATADTAAKVRLTWQWQRAHEEIPVGLDPLFDDYVADGLVMHLDGIRNVGVDKPHDWSSSQWVDLKGGNVASFQHDDADASTWQADGYWFGGRSFAQFANALSGIVDTVTVEIVCDTTTNALEKLRVDSGGTVTWPNMVGTGDSDVLNVYYDIGRAQLKFKNANGGTCALSGVWQGHYATAIRNGNMNYIMQGTSLAGAASASTDKGGIGGDVVRIGSGGATLNLRQQRWFVGTIKAVRIYNRVLTDEELEQNRAIDEARFFGGPLPVKNVVVASSMRGVEGNEPEGTYALPPGGHTFSAPASVTVGEDTYFCTGYTLETWNGLEWESPVSHNGVLAASITDTTELVRLTWQWTHTAGPGYDAAFNDYAADGLVLQLDGIRNAGVQPAHDSSAASWADLAAKGGAALFVKDGASRWLGDGFYFDGTIYGKPSYAVMNGKRSLDGAFTVQAVLDFDGNASHRINVLWPGIVGTTDVGDAFALYYNQNNVGTPGVNNKVLNTHSGFGVSSWGGEYITSLFDGNQISVFQTAAPSEYKPFSQSPGTRTFTFASGEGSNERFNARRLNGVVKAVRFYNRALTSAELERNRAADEVRFFGRAPAASGELIVRSDVEGLSGTQPNGAYRPARDYVFTAPREALLGGVAHVLAGYTLETWNGSDWSEPDVRDDVSEALIDVSSASARLTWNWRVKSRITKIRNDYDVGDYVQDGLVLHFDGIRNAGADVAHDPVATTWVNLGTAGDACNAEFDCQMSGSTASGSWAADGYSFVYGGKFAKILDQPALDWQTTVQVVCEAGAKECDYPSLFGSSGDYCNIYTKDENGLRICFKPLAKATLAKAGWDGEYVNAIWHGGKYALFCTTVPEPADWTGTWRGSMDVLKDHTFYIGGVDWGNDNGTNQRRFTGKIQAVRVYRRSLSDEELAHNRIVDDARFKGRPPASNVTIVCECSELDAAETPGDYLVEGTYTFTATTAIDKRGKTRPVVGYTIRTWNGSAWGAPVTHKGTSYTYAGGASPAKVKLKWNLRSDCMVFMIR